MVREEPYTSATEPSGKGKQWTAGVEPTDDTLASAASSGMLVCIAIGSTHPLVH